MWRQGDLLIKRVDSIPEKAKPREDLVLARGEATGHAHRLTGGRVFDVPPGLLYFEIDEETDLVHEEHGPITFSPGKYEVVRQREYTPEGIATVLD